jgi:nucleotide-binding universal stress UspA family protein
MYATVLLAYDGSVEGRRALREGARIAQICKSEVFLLAVVNVSAGIAIAEGAAAGAVESEWETYEEVLAEGVRRLKGMGFSPSARLGVGDPAQQIEAVAKEIGADLVVVGHRRQGPLSRLWFGSVTGHLIDHVDCSILVSRKEIDDEAFHGQMQGRTNPA